MSISSALQPRAVRVDGFDGAVFEADLSASMLRDFGVDAGSTPLPPPARPDLHLSRQRTHRRARQNLRGGTGMSTQGLEATASPAFPSVDRGRLVSTLGVLAGVALLLVFVAAR
ncbi:MAG: hypothetical protein HPM95_08315 [Alphaproteobacteria bacterium]|nr:hypothetical protein [Alphaproteobacteria bacterium]